MFCQKPEMGWWREGGMFCQKPEMGWWREGGRGGACYVKNLRWGETGGGCSVKKQRWGEMEGRSKPETGWGGMGWGGRGVFSQKFEMGWGVDFTQKPVRWGGGVFNTRIVMQIIQKLNADLHSCLEKSASLLAI